MLNGPAAQLHGIHQVGRLDSEIVTNSGALGVHWALKAGIERSLGEAFRLFLNYGDGFRSPQARSLADGERAPFVSVRGAELGATFTMPRVVARAAAFGTWVSDDFFFDQSVGVTLFTGATLRAGGTANVTAEPLDGWLICASGTVAYASVTSSRALLPYFAPLVGRLDTSYRRPFELFGAAMVARAGVGLTGIGSRPLPYNDFSSPVGLIDVRAGLRVWRIEATLDVQNLLNSKWRDGEFAYASKWDLSQATSLIPSRHFTAGAPRTFSLTLEAHL